MSDTKMSESDYFIGLGFPEEMVSEAIKEHGEENRDTLLQVLLTSYRHEVENLQNRILDNEMKSKGIEEDLKKQISNIELKSKETEEDLKKQISDIELKSKKTEAEISASEKKLQHRLTSLETELEKKNQVNSLYFKEIEDLKLKFARITEELDKERERFARKIMEKKLDGYEDLLKLLSTAAKEKALKEQHMEAIKQLSVNIQNLTNHHADLQEIMSRRRC
ncbi:hypothetical protein A2U01_0004893, partial [Trifolium medium]|nr:hypothetical protein [Trifolium medium]